jgi:recombination protein RecT
MLGDEERITHKPYIGIEDRGEIIAAYCIAKLKDGTVFREVMTRQEIDKVRRSSKAGAMSENDVKYAKDKEAKVGDPKGIWKDWYEEMARKTVFRRCAKWLPQAIELVENAFSNDDSMAVMEEKGVTTIDSSEFETIDNETGEIIEEPKNVEEQLEGFKEKNKKVLTEKEQKEELEKAIAEAEAETIEVEIVEGTSDISNIFPGDLPFKK